MKYRAEIDGLRALAVVPVILFHAGFELFSGGFVGVDIFFVISGYLITTILIEDIESKRFSIISFYERRARRILPALFFVMLICVLLAWMWMLPGQMKRFSQSLVAVSLFASNIFFLRRSGYFDAAAEENPLLHTWSLAVEEQYYIFFPIFLILVWRFGKNRVFWMLVVMAVISLLLSEWGWRNNATANFYLAPTRAWELFAGSIAAFIVQKKGVQKNNALALLGLSAIVFSILAYDEFTPFPSVYALVPVLGVVLLILFANSETIAARLLSIKILVGVGLISYSAYLWHQPLFAFARLRLIDNPSLILMSVLSMISLVLGYFSWKYIEKPFRNRKSTVLHKKLMLVFSLSGLFVFFCFGLAGHYTIGFSEQRYDKDFLLKTDINFLRSERRASLGKNNVEPSWVLIGDSHADALQEGFSKLLSEHNQAAIVGTKAGCPPALNLWRQDMDYKMSCHDNYVKVIAILKESEVKNVLVSARFALYINSDRFDNGVGGKEAGGSKAVIYDHVKFKNKLRSKSDRAKAVEDEMISFLDQLSELGLNIFLISSVPEVGWKVPERLSAGLDSATPRASYDNRVRVLNSFYKRAHSILNLKILKAEDVLCDDEVCIAVKGGLPLYYDSNHLSVHGARELMLAFEKVLMKNN